MISICSTLLVRCVFLDDEGRLNFLRCGGKKWRQQIGEDALIVKKVKDHCICAMSNQGDEEIEVEEIRPRQFGKSEGNADLNEKCSDSESMFQQDRCIASGGCSDIGSSQDSSCRQHCPICLEAFEVGESVGWSKILPNCVHAFHTGCIQHWLLHKSGCPCCRSKFIDSNDLTVELCCRVNARKLKWVQNRQRVISERLQGEFCVFHGLVFPSESHTESENEIISVPNSRRVVETSYTVASRNENDVNASSMLNPATSEHANNDSIGNESLKSLIVRNADRKWRKKRGHLQSQQTSLSVEFRQLMRKSNDEMPITTSSDTILGDEAV